MSTRLVVLYQDVLFALNAGDPRALASLRSLYGQFEADSGAARDRRLDFSVTVDIVASMPAPPAQRAYLTDGIPIDGESGMLLSAFHNADGSTVLHVSDGVAQARATIPNGLREKAVVQATAAAIDSGMLGDVLANAVAALLRPHGIHMLHAFAAEKAGRAILLVGESGSGKTTTGLNLLGNDWRYLANDMAFLRADDQGIVALPSPGAFSIRPYSLSLLPRLRQLVMRFPADPRDGKHHVAAEFLVREWAMPTLVSHIVFLSVSDTETTSLEGIGGAISLAKLMADNVDRWDEEWMPQLVSFLGRLCQQAPSTVARLGRDVDRIPERLEALLYTSGTHPPFE